MMQRQPAWKWISLSRIQVIVASAMKARLTQARARHQTWSGSSVEISNGTSTSTCCSSNFGHYQWPAIRSLRWHPMDQLDTEEEGTLSRFASCAGVHAHDSRSHRHDDGISYDR